MASPEQIGEWLNEELNIERPVGEGGTVGVQLNDLVPEQHAERAMGDIEEIQQVLFISSPFFSFLNIKRTCFVYSLVQIWSVQTRHRRTIEIP